MKNVFILVEHDKDQDGGTDPTIIDVFSTYEKAEETRIIKQQEYKALCVYIIQEFTVI
jgi:hypothetical protein